MKNKQETGADATNLPGARYTEPPEPSEEANLQAGCRRKWLSLEHDKRT